MGFGEASAFLKIGLVGTAIGTLFHLIGFSTSYWQRIEVTLFQTTVVAHSGLWSHEGNLPGWFEAVQAFETLGFIAALAALILVVLYIFVPATSGKRIVFILSMIACFAAAGCILLGIIIYGSKMSNLSWSFALSTIGGVIFAIAAILLVIDMLKR